MAARVVDGSNKQTNGRVNYIIGVRSTKHVKLSYSLAIGKQAPAVGFPTSETVSPTPKKHSELPTNRTRRCAVT